MIGGPPKEMENHAIIGRCLQVVKLAIADLARSHFPDEKTDDVANSLRLITNHWFEIGADFPRKARTLAHELREVRNEWAHQVNFSSEDTHRALDTAERFLRMLGKDESADQVKRLREPAKAESIDEPKHNPRVFRVTKPPTVRASQHGGCFDKLLRDIRFSDDPSASIYPCLMERLAFIANQVYGNVETKAGPIARQFAPLDFKWVNESRLAPTVRNGIDCLHALFHIGDTKEQGRHFFGLNPGGVSWPGKVAGYELLVRPYIKIANAYATALLWILPSNVEFPRTHTKRFFEEFSGSVRREDWENFDNRLSSYVSDWKNKCFIRDGGSRADWDELVTSKNFSKILVSVGTNLRIIIPYTEGQGLDTDVYNSPLAAKYREIIEEIKELVERPVKSRFS